MAKTPTPTEKAKWQTQKATKTSITQPLRTDLGRSVWETTATQLEHNILFFPFIRALIRDMSNKLVMSIVPSIQSLSEQTIKYTCLS